MKSTKDKLLIASIVLNIALAAGTVWSFKFMGTRTREVMASAIIGNTNNMRYVIEELDSGDPSRIGEVKRGQTPFASPFASGWLGWDWQRY